jgi:hypothetical protein
MEFKKKTSVVGEWAKKGQDIKKGDTVKLVDGGRIVDGQFGEQNVFSVQTRNGVRNVSLNQTSINALVSEYGSESNKWVGQELIVHVIKQNVQGKFIDVYYFVPDGYEMGDYGFEKIGGQPSEDDIPVISAEEIPF